MNISIICNADFTDDEELKKTGGDFWVKDTLRNSFHRLGHVYSDEKPDMVIHLFGWPVEILHQNAFNVLWIHSHPDLVTPEILSQYNKIFCLSPRFLKKIQSWGFDAEFLMFPTSMKPERQAIEHEIVFVANASRSLADRGRQIISDLLDCNDVLPYDLEVYGRNWDGLLPEEYYKGRHYPFQELGRLYASSLITLNDHHDDMKREGFINPRILDASASGGFVISDDLNGLNDIFGESVPTYKTKDELHHLIDHYMTNRDERNDLIKKAQNIALKFTYDNMAWQIINSYRESDYKTFLSSGIDPELKEGKLRINFLSPHLNVSGGVKRIITIADYLKDRGHETFVVTNGYGNAKSLKPEKAELIVAPGLSEEFIPDADITILCYSNGPGRKVMSYGSSKGEKFLLVLHFGVHSPVRELMNLTLPFSKLVTSNWLKEVCSCFQGQVNSISYGIDTDKYYPSKRSINHEKIIGMLYHSHQWKGVEDGIKAFDLAKEKCPGIKLILFGQPEKPEVYCDEYFHNPDIETIRNIYSRCDIFLCPSWREGIGMTSLEAMACKAALVTTDTCGSRDFAFHGETALVSPPKKPEHLGRNLIRLIEDENILNRLSENGYKKAREFTWKRSIDLIEDVFKKVPIKKSLFRKLGRGELKKRHLDVSEKYIHDNKIEEGICYLQKAHIMDPSDDRLLEKLGQQNEAILNIKEAVDVYEKYTESDDLEGLLKLAQLYESLGNNHDKRKTLARVYNRLGVINHSMQDDRKAEDYFMKSYRYDGKNKDALINLGELNLNKGDINRGLSYYVKASTQNDLLAESLNRLGVIYFQSGDMDNAVTYFKKAIEKNPNYAEAYINLGCVHYRQDRRNEALHALSNAEDTLFISNSEKSARELFRLCWRIDSDSRESLSKISSMELNEDDIEKAALYEDANLSEATKETIVRMLKKLQSCYDEMGLKSKAETCAREIEVYDEKIGAGIN